MDTNKYGKFPCPCCGYYTLKYKADNTFQICPVCYWEDDGIQFHDIDYDGGANTVSLREAKINFEKYGVIERQFIEFVRPPLQDEKK